MAEVLEGASQEGRISVRERGGKKTDDSDEYDKDCCCNADVDDTNGYTEYVTKNFYTNMDAM